jgi:hypothetical protein
MYWLALVLVMLAAPFWEVKAVGEWSDQELQQVLTDSPWAQMAVAPGNAAGALPVQVYLATAGPVEQAERERDLRAERKRPPKAARVEDPLAAEYRAWLADNRAGQVVVAVRVGNPQAFSDEKETRQMEEESVMRVGRKKFKITGHFPPSAGDPYLRLAFPRQVSASDKTVSFDLYLPGVAVPFRAVEFKVKDMMVKGKIEM